MKKIFLLFVLLFSAQLIAQNDTLTVRINGTIVNNTTRMPMANVHIINVSRAVGTLTNGSGQFEVPAQVNDSILVSYLGFQTIKVRVTNDWVKTKTNKIVLTEKAFALDEVIINRYNLTGYLEVDTKLIPIRENYKYSISGLSTSYEVGENAPGAVSKVLNSIFNPADMLYNFFGKKSVEMRKLRQLKKEDSVRLLLETKYDRETLASLLGIDKKEIPEILARCNYSESFIKTANDLQIMDAISACYEEYKVLKKK